MKVVLSLIVAVVSASQMDTATPIAKILDTLSACEAKVTKEGEDAQKVYAKFSEWCEDRATNLQYEVKTGTAEAEGLQATVDKEIANQQVLSSQIEDTAAAIATDEKDLAAATKIRGQETVDFQANEKDLVEVIDTLARAIAVIEREMASGGASMMQLKNANSLTQVLKAMVQASTMNTADVQKLTAFVQNSNDDDDLDLGAPAGAVYENHGGDIVDTLGGLRDQANEQLDKSRAAERTAGYNYDKLKQSLDDSIKFANADLSDFKKSLAVSQEAQAAAQGDLDVTSKNLAEDKSTLAGLHHTCLTGSQDFETEAKSRSEEMRGLALAKDAVSKIQLRGDYSFLQISLAEEPSRLAVHFIRNLARKQKDQVLAQVASRMASVVAMSSKAGEDPFAKIKAMIVDSIAKLQDEQAEDTTQKAYCDKELAEGKEKVASNKEKIEKHTTKINVKASTSLKVKAAVSTLQEELAKMTKEKLEMDNLRQEEKKSYEFNKAETAQSLEEIKFALKVLRDFYGAYVKEHTGFSSQDGTAQGVIAMLETVESEFSTSLAQMTAVEDAAVAEYNEAVKTFETGKIVKEKGIKYKTKEYMGLDKAVADETSDREGVQNELDANSDALSKLQSMCVGKAESYSERVARREAEMESLKETLDALESENSFVQRSAKRFRGGVHVRTA
jgi:chromosome segregation ATPase